MDILHTMEGSDNYFYTTLILIFNNIIQILIDYPVSEQSFKIKE